MEDLVTMLLFVLLFGLQVEGLTKLRKVQLLETNTKWGEDAEITEAVAKLDESGLQSDQLEEWRLTAVHMKATAQMSSAECTALHDEYDHIKVIPPSCKCAKCRKTGAKTEWLNTADGDFKKATCRSMRDAVATLKTITEHRAAYMANGCDTWDWSKIPDPDHPGHFMARHEKSFIVKFQAHLDQLVKQFDGYVACDTKFSAPALDCAHWVA